MTTEASSPSQPTPYYDVIERRIACHGRPDIDSSALGRVEQHDRAGRLEPSDSAFILAHPDCFINSQVADMSRLALKYPLIDPSGVELKFGTEKLGKEGQVAFTRIIPNNPTPGKRKVILATGLHHPTAAILDPLSRIAKKGGREIISVDLPGMGGSRTDGNQAVSSKEFYEAFKTAILATTQEGEEIDLMGYSLGSDPLGYLYRDIDKLEKETGRKFHAIAYLGPIPSETDRRVLGLRMSPSVANRLALATTITTVTGAPLPFAQPERYYNGLSPETGQSIQEVAAQEHPPANILSLMKTLISRNQSPLTTRLVNDPRYRLVLGAEDMVMELDQPERLQNKRGIYIAPNAGHAGLLFETDLILKALDDDNDRRPPIHPAKLYRRSTDASSVGVVAETSGRVGVQYSPRRIVGLALFANEKLGLAGEVGSAANALYNPNQNNVDLSAVAKTGLQLQLVGWPLQAVGGIAVGAQWTPGENQVNPIVNGYGGIEIPLGGLLTSVTYQRPLFGNDSSMQFGLQMAF